MSQPFIGEIKMFGGNFAPRGYAFCDGQLLAISQNQALFSILGTIYGGDGRTTFALPDLRSRVAIHEGRGPGLSNRTLGQRGGTETNTLTSAQLPSHSHPATVKLGSAVGLAGTGTENHLAFNSAGETIFTTTPPAATNPAKMAAGTVEVENSGGGQAVNNVQPFLAINYIIALQGIFPSRS